MKKTLRRAVVVCAAALGLALLTPLGPAALAGLLERGLGDWRVAIGEPSGAFLYRFSFGGIRCQNPLLGLDIEVESLAIKPWSWAVEVQAPKVRVVPVVEVGAVAEDTPADIELPISLLPNLLVSAGQLDWHSGEIRLAARDWQLSYRAVDDTSGLLAVTFPEVQGIGSLRSATLDLMLSAQRVDIGVLEAVGGNDSLAYSARASFALGLALPRPVELAVEATVSGWADSLRGALDLAIDGAVQPLRVSGEVKARGRLPTVDGVMLEGNVYADGDRLALDDLLISLLDGELTGQARYFFASDSLQTQLQGAGFELAGVSPVAGRVRFDLAAEAQLQAKRYTADFTADFRDLELTADERFDVSLKAEHRLDGATHFELDSRWLALAATGDSDLEGDYDFALRGTLWPAALLAGAAPVRIEGRALPDTLAVQLVSEHLPGDAGKLFGPLTAELHLVDHSYLDVVVRLERDLLVARSAIDFTRAQIDTLVVALDGLALARVAPGLGGQLDMDMAGSGGLAIDQWRFMGSAMTTALHYADWHNSGLALDFAWDRRVARGELRGGGVHVRAGLDAQRRIEARTEFSGVVLTGPDGGEVVLDGVSEWGGALDDMDSLRGHLALDSLSLSQGEWMLREHGPLEIDYGDGRFDLKAMRLQTPVGLLDLSGWAGFDSLAISAAWPNLSLDALAADLSAEGTGHLQLGGTIARPEVQGALHLAEVRLDTLSLGGVSLHLALRDSLLAEVEAEAGLHVALSSAVAPLLRQGTGRARLDIEATAADLGPALSYVLGHPLRGKLDLSGSIETTLGDSALGLHGLSGRIDLRGLAIETEVDADSLRLDLLTDSRFTLGEGRVALDSLMIGMQRYDRDRLALRPAGTMRLGGELGVGAPSQIGLALEGVELVFFGGPEGLADVRAELSGTAAEPELTAELAVETEDFGELGGRLLGDRLGGDLHLNWTTLIEDSLVVTGQVPWDLTAGTVALEQAWIEVHSEGIGLFVFADLLADLDHLDGRIGANLRVDGLHSALAISGQVVVEDLQLALLDIEPVYTLPDGELRFDGREIELVGFSAKGEPGRGYQSMELTGRIDLGRLDDPAFDVRLVAKRLACRYEDIFQADNILLDLSFAGAASGSELAGKIRLSNPRSEPTLVVFNAPPVPPPPPALRDEALENMALAVEVDLRALSLDSELAEVEASGAVEVGGTFYKPIFRGDVGIDEGHILVLNQQFEFTEGRVVFNSLEPTGSILDVAYDPLELDPELDLRATTKVQDSQDQEDYDVTLTLQGRAKTAAPQFGSVPARDFSDIFRLLAFGSLNTQNYSAAFSTVAGQLLSRRVEKVGIDEFAVLPSSTVVGANPGTALRVGKYFSELPLPLWVRYEALLNEMSSGEVRIEHKLKSFLTLTGSAQSQYDRYGLGIGLKKEF